MSHDADTWEKLRRLTRARIGLGRAGDGLPTKALLDFQMAHAKARDAVHGAADFDRIAVDLAPREVIRLASAAPDRPTYLRRPDLGRRLADGEAEKLPAGPCDVVFVIADGLSAAAVDANAVATLEATARRLEGLSIGPVVLAREARVALGDVVGAAMNAAVVAVLIGERPGLTAADSLGVYLTFHPVPGRKDAERNCLSNIHAHGMSPDEAGHKLAWLIREALRLKSTGVGLKEAAPKFAVGESGAGPRIA